MSSLARVVRKIGKTQAHRHDRRPEASLPQRRSSFSHRHKSHRRTNRGDTDASVRIHQDHRSDKSAETAKGLSFSKEV